MHSGGRVFHRLPRSTHTPTFSLSLVHASRLLGPAQRKKCAMSASTRFPMHALPHACTSPCTYSPCTYSPCTYSPCTRFPSTRFLGLRWAREQGRAGNQASAHQLSRDPARAAQPLAEDGDDAGRDVRVRGHRRPLAARVADGRVPEVSGPSGMKLRPSLSLRSSTSTACSSSTSLASRACSSR